MLPTSQIKYIYPNHVAAADARHAGFLVLWINVLFLGEQFPRSATIGVHVYDEDAQSGKFVPPPKFESLETILSSVGNELVRYLKDREEFLHHALGSPDYKNFASAELTFQSYHYKGSHYSYPLSVEVPLGQVDEKPKELRQYIVSLSMPDEHLIVQKYMAESFDHAEEQAENAFPGCYVGTISKGRMIHDERIDLTKGQFVETPKTWDSSQLDTTDNTKRFGVAFVDVANLSPYERREGFGTGYFQIKDQVTSEDLMAVIKLPIKPIREFLGEFMPQLQDATAEHLRKHRTAARRLFKIATDVKAEDIQFRRIIDHNGKVIVP